MIGIYKIKNKRNGLIYIGQSKDLLRRITSHERHYENSEIDDAIAEEGIENFEIEIIEQCSIEELNDREIYWISYYNSYQYGYNNTPGGAFKFNPTKDSLSLLSDDDIKLIRTCYKEQKYKSGAEVQRKFFPKLDKHLIAKVYNGQVRLDIMPEVYQNKYTHHLNTYRQLGESNPQTIVTLQDAELIRILYSIMTRNELIPLFPQYKERTIVSIISGQNWKHIPIYHKKEKRWTYPDNWTKEEIKEFDIRKETVIYEYTK